MDGKFIVHKKGKDIYALKEAILNAEEVRILSFAPFQFLFDNTPILEETLRNGFRLKFLIDNKDSLLLEQLSLMENRDYKSIGKSVEQALEQISLLSQIIYLKYYMGSPLHRQENHWKSLGLQLPRATMANWVNTYVADAEQNEIAENYLYKNDIFI